MRSRTPLSALLYAAPATTLLLALTMQGAAAASPSPVIGGNCRLIVPDGTRITDCDPIFPEAVESQPWRKCPNLFLCVPERLPVAPAAQEGETPVTRK